MRLAVCLLLLVAAQTRAAERPAEISYLEVLSRPSDPDLNLRYARQQLEKGDLRGASAAFSRVLIRHPELSQVRLIQASVLARMGAVDQAQAELHILRQDPSPIIRERAEDIARSLDAGRKTTRLGARLAVGPGWSSNKNSGPNASELLFNDAPTFRPGSQNPRSDSSLSFSGSFDARRLLDPAQGHELTGSYSHYRTHQRDLPGQDLTSDSGLIGATLRTGVVDLTPTGRFAYMTVDRDPFRRDAGGGLDVTRRLDSGGALFTGASYTYEDYAAVGDRQGPQWDVTAGARAPVGRASVGARYVYANKTAERNQYGYDRHTVGLEGSVPLAYGVYLAGGTSASFDDYKGRDLTISASERRELTHRARLSLGLPLAAVSRGLAGLSVTANYEFTQNHSTIPNYNYKDNQFSATFAWQWGI